MDAENTAVGHKLGQPCIAGEVLGFEDTAVLFIQHMCPVEFIDDNLGKTAYRGRVWVAFAPFAVAGILYLAAAFVEKRASHA